MDGPQEQRRTGISTAVVALSIGLLMVVLIHGGVWMFTGRDPHVQERWGSFLFQMVILAVPFSFLARNRVTAITAWITAAVSTAMFWGVFYAVAQPHDANIGLGLLTLVSPLIITGCAFAAHRLTKRSR